MKKSKEIFWLFGAFLFGYLACHLLLQPLSFYPEFHHPKHPCHDI